MPSSALEQGTLVNGCDQLGAVIGRDSFGITNAVWYELLNAPVAIKTLYQCAAQSNNSVTENERLKTVIVFFPNFS